MRRATVWVGLPVAALVLAGCSAGQEVHRVAYGVDGPVRVVVPTGLPYAVDAGTGVGDVRVDVARAAGAERWITARSGTGDVTVSGA